VTRNFALAVVAALWVVGLGGCIYQVPITADATRNVEERLLGDWVSKDGKNKLKVRRLDDSHYIVSVNGYLFRAYHSDVAETLFASVQEIETPERKYTYVTWDLSEDAKHLRWRAVSRKVIPQDINDPAAVQALLVNNLENAALYEDEQEYFKKK
jgi:hypothetical protein